MAGSIFDWSTTPATNATADAAINFAEGQPPGGVNDSARQLMARVAEFRSDLGSVNAAGAVVQTGGAADAYTLTTQSAFTAFKAGLELSCNIHAANTTVSTLNVNATGVKPIVNKHGLPLTGGQLLVGTRLALRSDAANWIAINIDTAAAATVNPFGAI